MKKCLIYGNCQAPALSELLLTHRGFNEEYTIIFQKPIHVLTKDDVEKTANNFKIADLIIFQHIQENYPIKSLSTVSLLKLIKPKAITIAFPVLYFNAYFPMLDTVDGNSSILNLVHDYIIMGGYVKSVNEERLINDIILNENLFPKQMSISAFNFSIDTLKQRELSTDIYISNFLQHNYKKDKLFFQFNHPTNDVLLELVSQIFNILNITPEKTMIDGLLTDIKAPIYKSTYHNLELTFENNYYNYTTIEGEKKLDFVVHRFYDYYQQFDKQYLTDIIKKKKAFLWNEIISNL